MDWSFASDPTFLASIRRHFVCLTGTLNDLDDNGNPKGDERHFCCSGFVIEIRGVWCFVTAGHVLHEIDNGVKRNQIRLLKCGLMDYFSTEARVKEPIPFPYQDVHRITVDDDGTGLDCGLIPLRDLFRQSIEANGVRPIPVASWRGHSPPRFDAYALLGLPAEEMVPMSRQGERGPQIGHSVTLTLVGVEPLASPPANRVSSPVPRFAGMLHDGNGLGSVKGMSGGPILGISAKNSGGWDYACIAVQGSWNKTDRMILGTPTGIVVDAINRTLDEVIHRTGSRTI